METLEVFSTKREKTTTSNLLRGDNDGVLFVVPPLIGLPTQKFLTTVGDGTGVSNIIQNYSGASTDIYYEADTEYNVYTFLITVSDNAKFNQIDYGAITNGLTNGVKLFIQPNGGPEVPLLSGIAIKSNLDFLTLTADTKLTSFAGTPQTLAVNFDLYSHYGMPLTLNSGDKFIVRLNDDFSTLVSQTFGLRGIKKLS